MAGTVVDRPTRVDMRAGDVALARTRVITEGTSAHGLYASKEYADTPVIDATAP